MSEYDERAGRLQQMNRASEEEKGEDYDESAVRRSIVYTREDITLVVSYLSSVNQQLAGLRRIGWAIVVLAAVSVIQKF